MKPKQAFSDPESAQAAQAYLLRKCRSGDEYLERGAMTEQSFAAAISKFRFDDNVTLDIELRNFSQFCLANLTDSQWLKLRTAIRVKRTKENTHLVSIDISAEAHQALKRISSCLDPDVSLSQVILELARHFPK